jgi:hypothetical protein
MNIVFAHFNTPIPKHLELNLARTQNLFPEHTIHLITNVQRIKLRKADVKIFYYQEEESWELLANQLGHDKNFRGNFWFTSAARFLALANFSRLNPEEFLHLESDVIISRDFPFELFSKSKSLIQFPIVSDSLAIASCLYIKNSKTAKYLAKITISQAVRDAKTTDMHILRIVSNDNKSGFKMLPTAPYENDSMLKVSKKYLKANSSSIAYYEGVFDGFNIGRYLFGDDPRNKRGFTSLRSNDAVNYLNVRKLKFSMNNSRDFPLVYDSESKRFIPVFALHIHSKKLSLFKNRSSSKKIRNAVESADAPTKTIFSFLTFVKSVKNSLLRRLKNLVSG